MPPRKPASKPSSSDPDPTELILSYLKAQNRPYSATDISSNLHNKVTKTKADKLLKEMLERKDIGGNNSGKQWVYWCLQDSEETAIPEELSQLDSSIASLRDVIPSLKSTLKSKTASLATLRAAPTTGALRESVEILEKKRVEMEARLQVLRSGSVKPVSKEEKENLDEDYRKWVKNAMARKRIWRELEGMLLENMTKEDLYDKLGIDDEP